METGSLIILGSGIKFLSHLTTEAKAHILQSDKVLYLINEPAMQAWIQKNHPCSESLDNLYKNHRLRLESYLAITQCILKTVRENWHVCVVLEGHPTVFAKPALDAAIQAKKEGIYTKILPGISAEACLFADLFIDPGTCGCQSFEATDLLIHKRNIDPASHLILWQVSVIGSLGQIYQHDNSVGLRVLKDYLYQYYPLNYELTIYEAAQYPALDPQINKIRLAELPDAKLSRISTLYIPPLYKPACDNDMLKTLGIQHKDLQLG